MGWRRRGVALGAVVLLSAMAMVAGLPAAAPAIAAVAGASLVIDGNTAGPNDWGALPADLLESTTTDDVCGNGLVDPDQLDGKLDDLDLDAPGPTPGNVVGKGDFCQVWRAVQAVPTVSGPAGGLDLILYGAWQRFSSNGEVTGYWPMVGPAPGKDDDYLIEFEYDSSGPARSGC